MTQGETPFEKNLLSHSHLLSGLLRAKEEPEECTTGQGTASLGLARVV